ncbi:MAG TPA: UvrD-helicase domain-containing protein [Polyangiaceae bacterium]
MPDLNPAQREAVMTRQGPLLVLAGAGTGKTRVITYRIAELIRNRIQPHRILAVTFTNKAAREMKERALHLLGRPKKTEPPEISTFHALCVRILRRHIDRLGYPKEFTIYDRGDQETLARTALRDIRVGHQTLKPGELLSMISGLKSQSLRPGEAEARAEGDVQHLCAMAYVRYQAALKAAGAVDFDDLLLLTEELFRDHPEARYAEASRFDHLLIDEYQDTNGLQYRIVKALAQGHRNLCVVGDDDQSIYGWRGAEVTHILNFKRDWQDAKVVRLEENYRSTPGILGLANTLIAHNSTRHQKTLKSMRPPGPAPRFFRFDDETKEAEAVVRDIRSKLAAGGEERVSPSDIAILFRTNEQPRAFELELRREKVPYVLIGGMSFYDRKEVKDLLGYMKVLANPADEVSLLRIINTPPRGIGTGSIEALLEKAVAAGKPLWSLLPDAGADGSLSHAVSERIEQFRQLIERYRADLGKRPLSELFQKLLEEVAYRAELERVYKTSGDVEARWAVVEELVNSIALYESRTPAPTLLGFLEETVLSGREDLKNDDKERKVHAVTLMTLHSAKGLEFPHVYLVGMEEGLLPHQRSVTDGARNIDEERRLCYVGVTRAQEFLTITMSKTRMKWGKPRPSLVSRFVMEMRGETERARRIAEQSQELFAEPPKAPVSAKKTRKKAAASAPRKPTRA